MTYGLFHNIRTVVRSAVVVPGIAAMALAIGTTHAQTFDAKIANCVSPSDAVHVSTVKLKEALTKRTNGRITSKIFPSCQLGKIPRLIEGLQLGTLEFFASPPGFGIGVEPAYQALDAPGVFTDLEHAYRVVTHPNFRSEYLKLGREKGMTVVSLWIHSASVYATHKPIRKLEDFKGMKLRVLATKVETNAMRRIGATGVPIPYSEVLQTLQRHTIDGVRSSLSVMANSKFFTVVKYVTIVNDTWIPLVIWASTPFMNKLPKDLRAAVMQAGKDVDDAMLPVAAQKLKAAEKQWTDAGAELIYLSDADHAKFMTKVKAVGEEFVGTNPATKDLYKLIKEVAAETR